MRYSTLKADYSKGNYASGIHFGVSANYNNLSVTLANGINNPTLLTFDRQIGHYDVTGTQFKDVFDSPADRQGNYYGGAGDDTFNISFGSVSGDSGFDTLNASFLKASAPDVNSGYQGYAISFDGSVVTALDNNRTLLTVNGVEKINMVGTYGNDALNGTVNDDFFDGSYGNDSLEGGSGNDQLFAINGADTVKGGDGNDILIGGGIDLDTINGGAGNDTIIDTDAVVSGGDGMDTLVANYSQMSFNGAGVHLGYLGEATIRERSQGSVTLKFDSIEKFDVTGTD